MTGGTLIERLVGSPPEAFAIIVAETDDGPQVRLVRGRPHRLARVADLDSLRGQADIVFAVPFRQVGELGYAHHDDEQLLVAVSAEEHEFLTVDELMAGLPDGSIGASPGGFLESDAEYESTVREVIDGEIGTGAGSNFVISRTYRCQTDDDPVQFALQILRRLVATERGSYWTFLVRVGDVILVGASPELHLRVAAGTATLNPISGTCRYRGPADLDQRLDRFLTDAKESEELLMVVDEELKMMSRMTDGEIQVHGPRLRVMSRLVHTEFIIDGATQSSPTELLRESLMAPTVTGSPLESAFAVIRAHESGGRGFYGGVVGLLTTTAGSPSLDSAIIIRTAQIAADGQIDVRVGATLVRTSDPARERRETVTKVAAMLSALRVTDEVASGGPDSRSDVVPARSPRIATVDTRPRGFIDHRALLARRRSGLSGYWTGRSGPVEPPRAASARRLLILDGQDGFTYMLRRLLTTAGHVADILPIESAMVGTGGLHHRIHEGGYDVVVLGPGPGDPTDTASERINAYRRVVPWLLAAEQPMVAVCLGHQMLGQELGLPVRRLVHPYQGTAHSVRVAGRERLLGFYNTYSLVHGQDELTTANGSVLVDRDRLSGRVHALWGPSFSSGQFHAESLLSKDGPQCLAELVDWAASVRSATTEAS